MYKSYTLGILLFIHLLNIYWAPTVSSAVTWILRNTKLLGHRNLVSRTLIIMIERNLEQYIVVNAVLAASILHRELWEYLGEKLTLN